MNFLKKYHAYQGSGRSKLQKPLSEKHISKESKILGPGLPAVVQWTNLCFEKAENSYLIDIDGNTFIDFMGGSGVNSIGHSHPKYIEALTTQLKSWAIGSFASKARLDMLNSIKEVLPRGQNRIQLYSGGTEAVEAALRLAKSYTKKFEFVGFWNAFHGKTMGSLALTNGAKYDLGPSVPGTYTVPYAYCYRCAFQLAFPSCGFACVEHLRSSIRHQTTGALAGIVVETVQGRAGNIPPPPGYIQAIKTVAQERDALLIVDESITGFGRTGKMFGVEHDEVQPDIIIVGKGMGGGFPVTGVISNTSIMDSRPYSDPSGSSSSYGGFPLACRSVDTTVKIIIEENLANRSNSMGAFFLKKLKTTLDGIPIVGEVRGEGLMIGIELIKDKTKRIPISKDTMERVFNGLLNEGLLVMVGGNSIRLYPPLTVKEHVVEDAIEILSKVLRKQSKSIV